MRNKLRVVSLLAFLTLAAGCSKDRTGKGWDVGAAMFGGETAIAHEQRVERERLEDEQRIAREQAANGKK